MDYMSNVYPDVADIVNSTSELNVKRIYLKSKSSDKLNPLFVLMEKCQDIPYGLSYHIQEDLKNQKETNINKEYLVLDFKGYSAETKALLLKAIEDNEFCFCIPIDHLRK
jgi:hypothetical protein